MLRSSLAQSRITVIRKIHLIISMCYLLDDLLTVQNNFYSETRIYCSIMNFCSLAQLEFKIRFFRSIEILQARPITSNGTHRYHFKDRSPSDATWSADVQNYMGWLMERYFLAWPGTCYLPYPQETISSVILSYTNIFATMKISYAVFDGFLFCKENGMRALWLHSWRLIPAEFYSVQIVG